MATASRRLARRAAQLQIAEVLLPNPLDSARMPSEPFAALGEAKAASAKNEQPSKGVIVPCSEPVRPCSRLFLLHGSPNALANRSRFYLLHGQVAEGLTPAKAYCGSSYTKFFS